MKLRIYLDKAGHKTIATGNDPWAWEYTVRAGEMQPPAGSLLLGELEVHLPSAEECIPVALATLANEEHEARMELQAKLDALNESRSKLLAITNEVQA